MRSGPRTRVFLAAVLVVIGAGVPVVAADSIDDQRQHVAQIADELDALENQIGALEEEHAAALDRIDVLTVEIADSQASVDAKRAELAELQGQLTSIAVDAFMSGGSSGLTPLFSSAATFTDDLQRGELSRVALDQGAGTSDEMEALVADLAGETQALEDKKSEQADLVASLEVQQQQGEALTVELQQRYATANAELGTLLAEEQERRVAAAVAAAQAAAQAQQNQAAAAAPTQRGGGAAPATPAAADPGSGSGGDPAPAPAPAPEPSVPAPSSKSGIAVGAAQGQLGVPYKFAAESPGVAFDCSGLTKYAWGRAGVYLPHQSAQQFASTPHVPKDQAQPGDLIFYYAPIGHVAIYLGGGSMIHAPASGDVVKVSAVNWGKVVGVSRPG